MNCNLRNLDGDGDQDLEWIAFCYIADELTEAEKTEFEIRLENDDLAQQAVVTAMEQSQTIYAALGQNVKTRQPVMVESAAPDSARNPIPGLLIATAAALVLMVAGWAWFANQEFSGTVATTPNNDSEQLADAWVYTLVALNDNEWDEIVDDEPELQDSDEESTEDWMFVALTDMEASLEGAE
jgi:hypothetical protein